MIDQSQDWSDIEAGHLRAEEFANHQPDSDSAKNGVDIDFPRVEPVEIRQHRVHDRRIMEVSDEGAPIDAEGQIIERFSSKSLPPYLRKTKSIEGLIPWLHLKTYFPEVSGTLLACLNAKRHFPSCRIHAFV